MEPLIWEEYFNQMAQEASTRRSPIRGHRIRRAAQKTSSKRPRNRRKKSPNLRP